MPVETPTRLDSRSAAHVQEQPDSEGVGTKLWREADVFALGTLSGIGSGIGHKFVHPLEAVEDLMVGYGGTRALALMQEKAGLTGLVAEGIGLAFTYSFCKDALGATASAGKIWSETWSSSASTAKNKAIVAQGFGGFLVDGAIAGYGSYRGARAGYVANQSKLFARELFEGDTSELGVVKVKVGEGGGSGFVIDDKHIVTNAHVVNHAESSWLNIEAGGKSFQARVLAKHPKWDLALLETLSTHELKPLVLASPEKTLSPGTEVVALRRGLFGSVKAAPGRYEEAGNARELLGQVYQSLNWFQKSEEIASSKIMSVSRSSSERRPATREMLLSRLVGAGHGWSGSPLVERSTGEVVGVVSGGYYNPKTRRPALSESIQGVRELLAQVQDHW